MSDGCGWKLPELKYEINSNKKMYRMYFISRYKYVYRCYKWNISWKFFFCIIFFWHDVILKSERCCAVDDQHSYSTLNVFFFFRLSIYVYVSVAAYWLLWNVLHAYCLVTPLQYITLRFLMYMCVFLSRGLAIAKMAYPWWTDKNLHAMKPNGRALVILIPSMWRRQEKKNNFIADENVAYEKYPSI